MLKRTCKEWPTFLKSSRFAFIVSATKWRTGELSDRRAAAKYKVDQQAYERSLRREAAESRKEEKMRLAEIRQQGDNSIEKKIISNFGLSFALKFSLLMIKWEIYPHNIASENFFKLKFFY